jgi:hypothetical protein
MFNYSKMTSKADMIKFIVTQTNYSEEIAEEKLKEYDYNYVKVIKKYLNPDLTEKKEPQKKRSTNERMMDEIRKFMDTANRQYIQRKEQSEKNDIIKKKINEKFLELKKIHKDCKFNPPNQKSCSMDCANPMCPGLLGEDNTYIKSKNIQSTENTNENTDENTKENTDEKDSE